MNDPVAVSTAARRTPRLRGLAASSALVAVALTSLACGTSSSAAPQGPLAIESVDVPGPPAGWQMASRMMNRQSASAASIGAAGGAGATGEFESISASMYFNPGGELPLTGTIALRTDSLTSSDGDLEGRLEAWLDPGTYPAFIFQTTGSATVDGVVQATGNLLLRDQIYPATSRWEVTSPVAINDEGRRVGELRATVTATVAGAPFPDGQLEVVVTMPSVGYTATFVEGVLSGKGIEVASITGDNPSYPSSANDLSDVAWYLMLAGHYDRALEVFEMSIDQSAQVNTYMRMADGHIFAGNYGMAVGTYRALEDYNLGHPHSLELIKILGGRPLSTEELAAINTAWTQG